MQGAGGIILLLILYERQHSYNVSYQVQIGSLDLVLQLHKRLPCYCTKFVTGGEGGHFSIIHVYIATKNMWIYESYVHVLLYSLCICACFQFHYFSIREVWIFKVVYFHLPYHDLIFLSDCSPSRVRGGGPIPVKVVYFHLPYHDLIFLSDCSPSRVRGGGPIPVRQRSLHPQRVGVWWWQWLSRWVRWNMWWVLRYMLLKLVWCLSENAALIKQLMKIHSNPPILHSSKKVTQHDFDRLYFYYLAFLFIKLDIPRKLDYLPFHWCPIC